MKQADYQKVSETILSRFASVFGPPKSENPEGLIEEYVKALGQFSEEELRRGGDTVLGRSRFNAWPLISECTKACQEVRLEIYKPGDGDNMLLHGPNWREKLDEAVHLFVSGRTDELWKWANSFRRLDLCQQADAEGWGMPLRNLLRQRVRTDLIAGCKLRNHEDYLPPPPQAADPDDVPYKERNWCDNERSQARRFDLAKKSRKENPELYRKQLRKSGAFQPVAARLPIDVNTMSPDEIMDRFKEREKLRDPRMTAPRGSTIQVEET